MDVVSPAVRSRMMSSIRGKDTNPELLIRKALFAHGFRYRLHDKSLPGKPDLVFPKYRAVIQINGCFWHGHGCHMFKWPSSRQAFWKKKITENKLRDESNGLALEQLGWRVLTVWECALRGRHKQSLDEVVFLIKSWLIYAGAPMEVTGLSIEEGHHNSMWRTSS
ncbi:DNA mismatch endonuclease Vsr [Kistimonas scapharcae]|uniref:DNA mismatch endonuclease Vsr n=1 Tax=Kistimonas scapharcae TaxID=1036133 RepID=A0ABP8V5D1_9GAMM